MSEPYKVLVGKFDSGIVGPGDVLNSSGWPSQQHAERVCNLMNEAYDKGYAACIAHVVKLLQKGNTDAQGKTESQERKPFRTAPPEDEACPF